MAQKTDAKILLQQSILDIMKYEPLGKITVSDITKNCNIRRETFYYHFIDKYDLIRWIWENKVYDTLVSDFKGPGSWTYIKKRCTDWLDFFIDNHEFVINALNDKDDPNDFHHSVVNCTIKINSAHAQYTMGTSQLTKEMLYYIYIYAHGIVDIAEDWARNDMRESENLLGEILANSIPGDLRKVYFENGKYFI